MDTLWGLIRLWLFNGWLLSFTKDQNTKFILLCSRMLRWHPLPARAAALDQDRDPWCSFRLGLRIGLGLRKKVAVTVWLAYVFRHEFYQSRNIFVLLRRNIFHLKCSSSSFPNSRLRFMHRKTSIRKSFTCFVYNDESLVNRNRGA